MTQTATRPERPSPQGDQDRPGHNRLTTDDGKINVAQSVVQKIAGIACREVSGVHAMGTSGSRAFGAIRGRIPGSPGPSIAQGVGVEVGESQAAVDLDVVVDYGVNIAELGRGIQRNVKSSIERMTGMDVVEVNVSIDDVYLPESGDGGGEPQQSRVQ